MGFYRGPNVVTNGLVLNLDAANTKSYVSGSTTWRDLSGNNNSGSLVNGPTFNSANGGSIVFDGVDDYVNFGSIPALEFQGTSSFSIEVTFKPYTPLINKYPALISRHSLSSPRTGYAMVLGNFDGSTFISIERWGSGTQNAASFIPTMSELNNNCIVQSTYDGLNLNLYANGNLKNSIVSNVSQGVGTPLYVARLDTTHYLNTNIYNIRIYNRALSASEVAQNYNAQKSRFNLT
jgi:hypothetical protein